MNPLPPIPLVDGVLLFDNSTLNNLVCPRKYELHCLRRRELGTARAGRNFGAALHCGWKARYQLFGNNAVPPEGVELINQAISVHFSENPQPLGDFRTLEHAHKVMAAYNRQYLNEPWRIMQDSDGKPAVESSFMHELGKVSWAGTTYPLWYMGRVDLQIEDNYGEWVFDHKTAFMFGKGFETMMATDPGQMGYCWHFWKQRSRLPRGYVIDAVRIRRPKKEDEYTGVAPVDATDLMRLPYFITEDNLKEWEYNTIKKVQLILYMHADGYFPQFKSQCNAKFGNCDMLSVCDAAEDNRQNILDGDQFVDYEWSPLNRKPAVEE